MNQPAVFRPIHKFQVSGVRCQKTDGRMKNLMIAQASGLLS